MIVSQSLSCVNHGWQRDVLQSGQLWGEDVIAGKAAAIAVQHGDGEVVMIGFRPQHRAQTHGTFKLLFNALSAGLGTAQALPRKRTAQAGSNPER